MNKSLTIDEQISKKREELKEAEDELERLNTGIIPINKIIMGLILFTFFLLFMSGVLGVFK